MTPQQAINTLRAIRRFTLYGLLASAALAAMIVAGTTLAADRYSTAALTAWCVGPLVAVTLHALLVIYVRDRFARQIRDYKKSLGEQE